MYVLINLEIICIINLILKITGIESNYENKISPYFYNGKRNQRDININTSKDIFHAIVNDPFHPTYQIDSRDDQRVLYVPISIPISIYCISCEKKNTNNISDINDFFINFTYGKKEFTYQNHISIETKTYRCKAALLSFPSGITSKLREGYATCYIERVHDYDNIIERHSYIKVTDLITTTNSIVKIKKIPRGARYLLCQDEHKNDGYLYFWGRLVKYSTTCLDYLRDYYDENINFNTTTTNIKSILGETSKICPIIETGLYLSKINQVQTFNLADYSLTMDIICLKYNINSPKKISGVIFHVNQMAPTVISVPIEANSPCVYPLSQYSSSKIFSQQSSFLRNMDNKELYVIDNAALLSIIILVVILFIFLDLFYSNKLFYHKENFLFISACTNQICNK
nr:MAG: hypothetical protein [Metapenaeopsis lamellata majanivirus]